MIARQSLLEEVLVDLAAQGYADSSPQSVLAAGEISETEFRAEFGDKDGCLFAAYEELTRHLHERSGGTCGGGGEWPERVRAGLGTLLEEMAAKPAQAKALVRSFPAIGPRAYRRYVEFLDGFVAAMREGRDYAEAEAELPDEVELMAIGAGESLIFAEIDAGRCAGLPAMLPEILFSVLVPFLGPERAEEEMKSAAAA